MISCDLSEYAIYIGKINNSKYVQQLILFRKVYVYNYLYISIQISN
mgnify:CR=1 FL=1